MTTDPCKRLCRSCDGVPVRATPEGPRPPRRRCQAFKANGRHRCALGAYGLKGDVALCYQHYCKADVLYGVWKREWMGGYSYFFPRPKTGNWLR